MRPHFPRLGTRASIVVAMMAWIFLLATFAFEQLQAQSITAYRIEWVRPNVLEISCTGDNLKLVYVWEGLEHQKGNCDGQVYEVAGSRSIELNELVDSRIDIRDFGETTHYTYFAPPHDQVIMPLIVSSLGWASWVSFAIYRIFFMRIRRYDWRYGFPGQQLAYRPWWTNTKSTTLKEYNRLLFDDPIMYELIKGRQP